MSKKLRIHAALVLILLTAVLAYYLYDRLKPPTHAEKLADIIHLEDQRQLSERLKEYLHDSDPVVRSRAALAVGRTGGQGSGELLFGMLFDSSIDVAAMSAFALGLSGEKDYALQLLDMASDLPSAVAARAVEAAGRLGRTAVGSGHSRRRPGNR